MTQLALCFAPDGAGRTLLVERRAAYPYSVTAPIMQPGGIAQLTLQSISGGLYGGEHLSQHIHVRAGASARLLQPAATTVRRTATGHSRQSINLNVGENAFLVYAARPLIMLPGAALAQDWNITIAPGARVMFCDGFVSHSPRGEAPSWFLASRVTIRGANGALLASERMAINGLEGGFTAFGKFWSLGHGASGTPPILPELQNIRGGITTLPNQQGFVIALAAPNGGALCAAMEQIQTSGFF